LVILADLSTRKQSIMSRILLAEDDATMRIFLAKALERAGHDVFAVGDGLEALSASKAVQFDLLVAGCCDAIA
jgi:two-component system cell cycle response regulator CpdR